MKVALNTITLTLALWKRFMKERISLQIKNIREDEREVITRVSSTIKLISTGHIVSFILSSIRPIGQFEWCYQRRKWYMVLDVMLLWRLINTNQQTQNGCLDMTYNLRVIVESIWERASRGLPTMIIQNISFTLIDLHSSMSVQEEKSLLTFVSPR